MENEIRTTGYFYNELEVGASFRTRSRTVTESDLVGFCNLTWMTESLFTDTTHARDGASKLGQVIPGVMVYAMAEGLLTYAMEGTGLAFLHADFSVKGPTHVGDTIHVEAEIIEMRPTSKPGRGLVRSRNRVLNAEGNECIIYEPLRMLRMK
ncbi:MAG: MaoC family dehydratase N-terminal domain-containing protein [Rhodobacteraceae bacterium]|nr:MaoC family dehydratase N-terminal domain-containing protein [Paracoccaceae bacterium]